MTDKEIEGCAEKSAQLFLMWISVIFGPLIQAWVVSKLWSWFVVNQFNIEVPKFWIIVGLIYTAKAFYKPDPGYKDKYELKKMAGYEFGYATYPLPILIGGWIVHHFFV